MCRKSTSDVAPGRRMSNRIPVDRKTFCLYLQCVKMRELSLLRLFYLRAFAQLHSLYALTLWTRVSPCGTMCRCVAFSLFLLTVYLCSNYQTAFESCKHANDFLWAHQFFRHLKLPECMHACIQWLMSLFTWLCMVCLLCLVSRFHTVYVQW